MFGYTQKELEKYGDLSQLGPDEIRKLIEQKTRSFLGLDGSGKQKVIAFGELKSYIEQGWEYVRDIPRTNEAIVGLR